MSLKVGDYAFVSYLSFFDIREVQIIKETDEFFIFEIDGKKIRRRKDKFKKTKMELLEMKLKILNFNLESLQTNGLEVYNMYKEINKKYPELLI